MRKCKSNDDNMSVQPRQLFRDGKYKKCLLATEHLMNSKGAAEKWTTENNLIVCKKIINNISLYETDNVEFSRLKELLVKVQGVPVSRSTLQCESVLVFNACMLHLYSSDNPDVIHDHVLRFLLRVQNSVHRLTNKRAKNNDIRTVLHSIRDCRALVDPDCLYAVCLVSCVYCVSLLLARRHAGIIPVLHMLISACNKILTNDGNTTSPNASNKIHSSDNESGHGESVTSCFPLPLCDILLLSIDDILQFLHLIHSLSLYAERAFSTCIQQAAAVKHQKLVDCARLIEVHALYHQGIYDVCSEKCGELAYSITNSLKKDRLLTLAGHVYHKQNKFVLSVHSYKSAYSSHTSDNTATVLPLYYVSRVYMHTKQTDTALETLHLLVKSVQQQQAIDMNDSLSSLEEFCYFIMKEATNITYEQAVYNLAHACYESKRFDAASDKYLHLLSHLRDHVMSTGAYANTSTTIDSYVTPCCTTPLKPHDNKDISVPPLPDLLTLYHEAGEALLAAHRYEHAILVCNQAITHYTQLQARCSHITHIQECIRLLDVDVIAMRIKSQALLNSDHRSALILVDSAIACIEDAGVHDKATQQPACKRAKLDETTGTADMQTVRANIHTRALSCLYRVKCECLLCCDNELQAALRCSRQAVQLHSDIESYQQHCQVLMKLNRLNDAARLWVKYRKLDINDHREDTEAQSPVAKNDQLNAFDQKMIHILRSHSSTVPHC